MSKCVALIYVAVFVYFVLFLGMVVRSTGDVEFCKGGGMWGSRREGGDHGR